MPFDRMRVARIGLVIGWVLVSMLVVAGFAAFSAGDEVDETAAAASLLSAGIGRTAGAVTALAFAGTTEATVPIAAVRTFDLDPTVQGAEALGLTARVNSGSVPSDIRGGVYVRSGYLSETELRAIVARHFREADVNRAIRVAWCSSSFNPTAINPATGASGLFQHLPDHWAERSTAAGVPETSMFDPDANVAVAAWMLYDLPGGWSHWDCAP